jgi:hypothetical protein
VSNAFYNKNNFQHMGKSKQKSRNYEEDTWKLEEEDEWTW